VVASEDALFLAPAHRPNAFLMIALLRYAEQVLIELGATRSTRTARRSTTPRC
jgi:hypothetical protein